MLDPFTSVLAGYLVANVPNWLADLRNTLLDKSKEATLAKGKGLLDEREQQHALQQVLNKAAKRGLIQFRKQRERNQYKVVLTNLFEPGEHSDAMRRATMTLFNFADTPDLVELNAIYNQSLRSRNLSQATPPAEVDAAPYLVSFFDALLVEMYYNSFFRSQISDAIQTRAARLLPQQMAETNTTLHEIHKTLKSDYTDEQFDQDIATYTAYVESTLHNLKIIGFLSKDYNKDPEINGIFVPLHVALSDSNRTEAREPVSLMALLLQYPHLVLLGDPGSGKSTTVRHLAWSHAWANLNRSESGGISLLPGQPLPLRIELRLFMQHCNQHPDYNFLLYATNVLMKRNINIHMFERLLTQQRMLILFDGLDEVTTLDERQRLVQEIEHFVHIYPNNYTLVTSRPVGYNLASCSNRLFMHSNVQGFNDEQIHQFLERWYKYVLGLSPLPDQEQQELETLFATLKENTRLHKLAENPLLLTVVTGLYRSQRLPEKRVQVYEKCAEILLETWAKVKGTNIRWANMKMGRDDQSACVAHLGFQLHSHSQEKNNDRDKSHSAVDTATDVSAKVIRREIEHFLSDGKRIIEVAGQRKEAELFLRLMQEEAGLIVERGTDETGETIYGFVHRTFQEYFAAADVYGRFEQDEDPTILHNFLVENLHDPHWREVILLLLGKLGRKRVTVRLRQILDGKIRSRRSHYTEILQQDLFFICDCLIDEMDIESDFAEAVVSRIGNVVTTSPFSSQRSNALSKLAKLMQTRQFAILGKKEWIRLATLDTILDIKIQILATLRILDLEGSDEPRLAIQMLVRLIERPDLTIGQEREALQALYESSPQGSEEEKIAIQRLLEIAQRPDLTVGQTTQMLQALYESSPQGSEERKVAGQRLLEIAQRPDLTVEQVLEVLEALHEASEESQLAVQRLLEIAQRPGLTVEQTIQVLTTLYRLSPQDSEEEELVVQRLLEIAQRPGLTVEQTIQALRALYNVGPLDSEEKKLAVQCLLEIAQRPDLTVEQTIQALRALYNVGFQDSEGYRMAIQLLWQRGQSTDILLDKRLSIVTIPLEEGFASYADKLRSIQAIKYLIPINIVKEYIKAKWYKGYIINAKEVIYMIECVKQEVLPDIVLNDLYESLTRTISQFNVLSFDKDDVN